MPCAFADIGQSLSLLVAIDRVERQPVGDPVVSDDPHRRIEVAFLELPQPYSRSRQLNHQAGTLPSIRVAASTRQGQPLGREVLYRTL